MTTTELKITKCKQHYIDWESVGGKNNFIAAYRNANSYYDRRTLIAGLPMQTNPEWLKARRAHITCSGMKDFLGMDRSGKKAGVGYKNVVKKLVAEELGWEEPEATYAEKDTIKRGLVFESRAIELFEKETGIKLKSDLGFVSTTANGLPFGASLDAYAGNLEEKKFDVIAEVKSFELQRLFTELEILHDATIMEQTQGQMFVCNCPRAYKILYCAELDKIFYLRYTRGMDFGRRLEERIPLALEYRQKILNNLQYTNLEDKIMDED